MGKADNNRKAANKKVVDILHEFGDDGKKKREVTHWFYFKNYGDMERFEKYAFEIGYRTIAKDTIPDKGNYLLIIFRKEGINHDSINFDTIDFSEKAEEFNGFYDGWETSIEMD